MNSGQLVQTVFSVSAIMAIIILGGVRFLFTRSDRKEWPLALAFLAVIVLEASDLSSLVCNRPDRLWEHLSFIVAAAMPSLWLLVSLTFLRTTPLFSQFKFQLLIFGASLLFCVIAVTIPLDALFYCPDFPAEQILFLKSAGYAIFSVMTIFLVIALMNLESTLNHASPRELWRVKFDLLGVGTIIAGYLLYFSQGLLFRTIDLRFTIARSLFIITAVGLMFVAQSRKDRPIKIRVSRQVTFKSIVILAVGLYLIIVGTMGEGLKYLGVPFQKVMVIFLALAGGISLILVFISGKVRREVVVFLNKHFFDAKYDYRAHWLEFTHRLATPKTSGELQRVILHVYCETFAIQGGAVFLFDHDRQLFSNTAVYEMDPQTEQFTQDSALVRYLLEKHWVFNIQDHNLPISDAHAAFMRQCQVSFVIPLFADGALEGFIVLGKPIKEHEKYIFEDFDLMKTFASQATVSILNQRLAEQVIRLREMEAIGNISTFVIHDLKNHVAALSLLVDNARQYLDNPDFQQDLLRSLDNTVSKMQGLIGRLKNLGDKELLNLQPVDLLQIARNAADNLPGPQIIVAGPTVQVKADADELQKVILNFLINAVEASPEQLPIKIETGSSPQPFVRVIDQGIGMSFDFLRRDLFKPFMTTKKKGLGIGLYQCRRIVEAHGGRIDVLSDVGAGSTFTVWLPVLETS